MTKDELRGRLKARRAEATEEEQKRTDEAIVQALLASAPYQRADAILLYAPVRGEVDLIPLARRARAQGKTVAFPRCDTESKTMRFHILTPDARLTPGAYGIPEPPADAPLCPLNENTLCLVPGLSFDPMGNRLGYGGGYYDRFLTDFPGISAGVLPRRMMVRQIPTEPSDVPVDLLFCEGSALNAKASREQKTLPVPLPRDPNAKQEAEMGVVERDGADEPHAKGIRGRVGAFITRARAFLSEHDGTRPLHAPPALVACIFVLLLITHLLDTLFATGSTSFGVVMLMQILVFALPALLYGRLKGSYFWRRLRIRFFRPEQSWFLLCTLLVMITGSLLLCILTGGIESLQGGFTLYSTFLARPGTGFWRILWVILAYGLLPALLEEAVFRAFLCAEYEKYGAGVAIFASALFFALLHFSLPLFPSYLFLGLLLALVLYATRSFLAVFLLHLFYNLFCIFGQPYLSAFYVRAGNNEIFIFCLVTLFLLFSAFAAGEARKIYHHYAKSNLDSSYTVSGDLKALPRRLIKALYTPAVIPCVVIWLVMAIINLL